MTLDTQNSRILSAVMNDKLAQALPENKQALLHGLARMKHYGGAEPGPRTLVDALQPALEALVAGESLAAAAQQGADATAQMQSAKAGRSAYLNQQSLDGVKDPGAYAIEKVFTVLAR